MCRVKVDGEEREYPDGISILEIAKDYQKDYDSEIVLAKRNGKLTELFKEINSDCEIELLTLKSAPGKKKYREDMCGIFSEQRILLYV